MVTAWSALIVSGRERKVRPARSPIYPIRETRITWYTYYSVSGSVNRFTGEIAYNVDDITRHVHRSNCHDVYCGVISVASQINRWRVYIGECIKFYLAQFDFSLVRAFARWISTISSYLEALRAFSQAEKGNLRFSTVLMKSEHCVNVDHGFHDLF